MGHLNKATAQIVENSVPEHMRTSPDAKSAVRISANTMREQAVYFRGAVDNLEYLLGNYFGGVP